MSRWWSVGAVVIIVFMLGCCALSLSLSQKLLRLRFGSLDMFRCVSLVSSFVIPGLLCQWVGLLRPFLGSSTRCNLFVFF
jgi:hypothetical protein